MNRSLVSISRRLLSGDGASNWRCYCSSSPPKDTLFVGGLSWSVDEKSLKDAFSSFGEVTEVRILYDKETGRSRGFGFVNFSKGVDAGSARDAMDGKEFVGRPLRISFAHDKVRGLPVVVPRVRHVDQDSTRNTR